MFETGVGIRNPLFFIGVVENNVDERLEGRVQVRAFGVHGTNDQVPTASLPWATVVSGMYDPNTPVPPLNSWVFGLFLDGRDAQQPLVLGMIPTQMVDPLNPALTGWGVIPPKDINVLAQGSRPTDYGQPANSRLARGEDIQETYNLLLELNRVKDIPAGSDGTTWEEPASAYNAQYPYNRVIETAGGHSIELDDTPGAERIMIWHKSGSYAQIDTRGTTTHKSVSDKYDINESNMHVYIGGKSIVVIEGDSYVRVNGNKTEEIMGDFQQIVHQNYMLSVAGQMNLNASEDIQARAAKIRIESNVENINIKAAKSVDVFSTKDTNIKASNDIFIQSTNNTNILATNINSQGSGQYSIHGADVRMLSDAKLSLRGTTVAIDDYVYVAENLSDIPTNASAATAAEGTSLPEPATKSVGMSSNKPTVTSSGAMFVRASFRNPSSIGSVGFTARDDVPTGSTYSGTQALSSSVTTGALQPLLDLIARGESSVGGGGYTTVYSGVVLPPPRAITSMTISELLQWQNQTVAAGSISNAAGRYQVIESTLKTAVDAGIVALTDYYTPQNQDNIAIYLLKVRGLNAFITGAIDVNAFGNNLAMEWASFPVMSGPYSGQSYYAGIAGNQANISITDVSNVLNTLLSTASSNGGALA